MTETVAGIEYSHPTVILLQETGIGTAEVAARTCYDSFEASENRSIQAFDSQLTKTLDNGLEFGSLSGLNQSDVNHVNRIEHSDLLDKLAWTHFHHSILEHANLTFLIKGTSRGVLQEQARHRIQSLSVRSTRYTMSSVINAFVASLGKPGKKQWFIAKVSEMNMLVTGPDYEWFEWETVYNKLTYQHNQLGRDEFIKIAIAKSSIPLLNNSTAQDDLFKVLEAGKSKRNVGDSFKHIVTDNWKVDLVVTMNLRALKNYLDLRDSGAAYFQIRWLAQAIKDATPSKYLDLIVRK